MVTSIEYSNLTLGQHDKEIQLFQNFTDEKLVFRTLQEISDHESKQRLPTVIYLCVLIAVGLFGNTLVFFIYMFRYKLCNFRTYVLCLASLDLLACCIAMPAEIVDNHHAYMFYSDIFCKIARFCGYTSKIGSAFVITIMAIDRHKKVCYPFNKSYCPCKARTNCVIGITVSLILSCPKIALTGAKEVVFPGNVTGYDCTVDIFYVESYIPFIYTVIQSVIFLICFSILIMTYLMIAIKLLHQSKRPAHTGSLRGKIILGRSRKVTRLMLCISLALILSYLPHFVLTTMTAFKRTANLVEPSPLVLGTLPLLSRSYFVNNVLNPVIYYFGDKQFREVILAYCSVIFPSKSLQQVNIEMKSRITTPAHAEVVHPSDEDDA